jgi:hypothetical protein
MDNEEPKRAKLRNETEAPISTQSKRETAPNIWGFDAQ